MSEKSNAGGAGSVTPVATPAPAGRDTPAERDSTPDPFGEFEGDEHRLKAVESRHEAEKEIARTQAWESVLKANLRPILAAAVLVVAIACGVQMPWALAAAGILGRAVTKA